MIRRLPLASPILVALSIPFLAIFAPPVAAQEAAPVDADRPDAFVAATGAYSFFSDPLVNLHDLLVSEISSEEPVEPEPDCLARLPEADREAFEAAGAHYEAEFEDANPGHDDRMLDLRFHLIGHPEVDLAPDSVSAGTVALLEAALPAYRACWWERHEARNRAWIAEVVPLLIEHEAALRARVAAAFDAEWDGRIPVDAVGYVNFSGANTIVNPDHVLMSSADPSFRGWSALEMILHESSHTLLSPRRGAATEALAAASREAGLDRPPRNLWHAILFYTTGRLTQWHLADHGVPDYEPYLYREGVLDRAWPEFREPLEEAWEPYLEGRVTMEEAARELIAALRE